MGVVFYCFALYISKIYSSQILCFKFKCKYRELKNVDFRILKIILYLMFRILKYYCNAFEEFA